MSITGFYDEFAISEYLPANDTMHAGLIDQTEKAVVESLEKMCGPTSVGDLSIVSCPKRVKIVGIISFVGDLMWTLNMVLPHDSAESLARKFAGFEIPFESHDMGDVVGEIINVIAGVLSGNLERFRINSRMSLPTVVRGDVFELMLPDHLVSHRMYFSVAGNDLWIDVTASKKQPIRNFF